ncbi:MAG: hypothetical protein ACFFFG_09960 [Candidatus Thorarchaeota archaeon]
MRHKIPSVITIILFLIIGFTTVATRVTSYHVPPLKDEVNAVIATADGGYLLAGSTDSLGTSNRDMWLVKTDGQGTEQWNQTFGGPEEDWAKAVIATADGGYLLAGSTDSLGTSNRDMWLVKTDGQGTEQWNRTFGGPSETTTTGASTSFPDLSVMIISIVTLALFRPKRHRLRD